MIERLGDYLWESVVDYIQEEDQPEVAAKIVELLEDVLPKALEQSEDIWLAAKNEL